MSCSGFKKKHRANKAIAVLTVLSLFIPLRWVLIDG